jgi:hypothetical protein
MRAVHKSKRAESGIALLTTMLLLLLMSSLLVGFVLLISSGQKLSGLNNDYSKSFYAAEAGMEKLTADIGTLFNANYAPTGVQLTNILTKPPVLSGIQYVKFDGKSGYEVTYPVDANGNPAANVAQVKHGPFQGMTAVATPYTLTVTARTTGGSEVKLQRTTQTVGIPLFQFGVFSDTDLSFFPGPNFNFGGRTHTNGNLFLAAGAGLTLADRVTAFKDVIRTNLSNGFPTTTGAYSGAINIYNGSSTRPLAYSEGSLLGTVGTSVNPIWSNISLASSNYAGNLLNGATGARQLNLGIVTLGNGTTQAIDVIRRPVANESAGVTGERYFAQASFKILLSDNPADIMNLPCVDTTTQPVNLADLVGDPNVAGNWTSANAVALKKLMTTRNAAGFNTPPVSLAGSGAKVGAVTYKTADNNGYWAPGPAVAGGTGTPIIKGYIKIEIQTNYIGIPCGINGSIVDVTLDVLGYGYAGRNINTYGALNSTAKAPTTTAYGNPVNPGYSATGDNPPLLPLGAAQVAPSNCPDVHPNAIIRLERVRDNPSNWTTGNTCGVTLSALPAAQVHPTRPTDYWPNTLFDTREGTLRDAAIAGNIGGINYSNMVSLGGVMGYVELDANNLVRYLSGLAGGLPGLGSAAYDPNTAPNNYAIYISDRRTNYIPAKPPTAWPPLSPSGNETGEYGFQDFVNDSKTDGCPDGAMGPGEDLDGLGAAAFFTYGQDATRASQTLANGGNGYFGAASPATVAAQLVGVAATNALTAHPKCPVAAPTAIWPFTQVIHANEARENANFFFRRAVKIVNGSNIANVINNCPGAILCGLTIAAENPVYVQGDYNCTGPCNGNNFSAAHVATAVLGDSVTLLSNNWNDVNSFLSPYNTGNRNAVTTYYRTAIMGGKGVSFAQPGTYVTSQDFGTDGGLHNFLRYIENWGGQTLNYRGSLVSLFYNRQGIGVFKCCATVYNPPTRGYNFDTEFLTPNLLPPRTPLFRDVNTTGFTQLLLPTQ